MPRGRHRHSPPLHRLLPPSGVAGAAVVCAAAAWLFAEPVMLRALAAAAAAAAVTGAAVMRQWDLQAGKRVAELTRARTSDEWRYEERTAELETDLDESRELRGRLEAKLRAKRVELANLRSEHAALLRRYATAESERASALERRRQLAIEAAEPTKALPSSDAASEAAPSGTAERPGALVPSSAVALRGVPDSGLYARANQALDRLARGGDTAEEADGGQGKPEAVAVHERSAAGHYTVPAAAAVVPHIPVRRGVEGGFDFFGNQSASSVSPASSASSASPASPVSPASSVSSGSATSRAVDKEDLADVVGEEALAIHRAESVNADADAATEPDTAPDSGSGPDSGDSGTSADADASPLNADQRVAGEVIDLTEHDETEQLNMAELRSAIS
ncbi:coiled-coil domain-containing protein [Streptomyces sp. O3]